jgi:hypothetical protein
MQREGTLVGSSLFVVFTYWIFSSMLYGFLSFMFSSSLTVLQAFSVAVCKAAGSTSSIVLVDSRMPSDVI